MANFELVFESREVVRVDWFSVGCNVGWLVILASYQNILQMFSTAAHFVRAHLEFCKSRGQTQ